MGRTSIGENCDGFWITLFNRRISPHDDDTKQCYQAFNPLSPSDSPPSTIRASSSHSTSAKHQNPTSNLISKSRPGSKLLSLEPWSDRYSFNSHLSFSSIQASAQHPHPSISYRQATASGSCRTCLGAAPWLVAISFMHASCTPRLPRPTSERHGPGFGDGDWLSAVRRLDLRRGTTDERWRGDVIVAVDGGNARVEGFWIRDLARVCSGSRANARMKWGWRS